MDDQPAGSPASGSGNIVGKTIGLLETYVIGRMCQQRRDGVQVWHRLHQSFYFASCHVRSGGREAANATTDA